MIPASEFWKFRRNHQGAPGTEEKTLVMLIRRSFCNSLRVDQGPTDEMWPSMSSMRQATSHRMFWTVTVNETVSFGG